MLFVLTGPESSAKSTLARTLSEHFSSACVEEVARAYLQHRPSYLPSDLLHIASLQQQAEQRAEGQLVFADTDLQVLHIWWQEKFGPSPSLLGGAYAELGVRHYLLCRPDLAWQADPLRENPHDRDRLFELYKADLQARGRAFSEISGHGDARFERAVAAVESVLSSA